MQLASEEPIGYDTAFAQSYLILHFNLWRLKAQQSGMESYKCDVCAKSFTGLVCFQQHEASEKHKRKVWLMSGATSEMSKPVNPDQFHCPVCMVSISGLDNYQKHVISLDHALKVQKKNGDLLSQSLSSTFELKTERNQPMESTVSLTSPIKVVAPFAECKPCQKQFSGPEPYQQHLVSAGHKKKCGSSNAIMQSNETNFSVGNEKINNNSLNDPQSPVSEDDLNKMVPQPFFDQSVSNTFELKTERNQLMESPVSLTSPMKVVAPFAECKPCQKQFSGPEPYQQHLVSAGHKKKCGSLNEIMQSDETDFSVGNEKINNNLLLGSSFAENQSVFKCDICVMRFSGPVPYQQHLVSNGHKKKINAAELSKQLATTGALPPPDSTLKDNYLGLGQSNTNDLQKWYCDICKKQCSGPIPYHTHILSLDHLKKLRTLEVEENLRKIKELGPFACFGNDEIVSNLSSQVTSTADLHSEFKSNMEKPSFEFKINDLNINVKSEETKILSDKFQINANDLIALPNLNIIPPEKLDVTVFGPDDEIVFSSPKKCRQGFLSEINETSKKSLQY
ncbi:hypothetical protein AVEN_83310-1 [Araneus ventricosus]|uniref:C2H2-type domain-containing protein n=1 Tax=Araneus ventricosus TaxID=182803 RepID=A0A4Y2MFK0_ARAVE|nr:hypothetical protein AVEN_83310-1 [Araneus ventricosus]